MAKKFLDPCRRRDRKSHSDSENPKVMGLSTQDIAQATGLTEQEIEGL